MFLQNCLQVPGYPKISNFGYPVPKITKNVQPYFKLVRKEIFAQNSVNKSTI